MGEREETDRRTTRQNLRDLAAPRLYRPTGLKKDLARLPVNFNKPISWGVPPIIGDTVTDSARGG